MISVSKRLWLCSSSLCVVSCLLIGCETSSAPSSATPNMSTDRDATSPTNSGVNVRDRDSSAKTPIDQNENQKDINITADIRKQVVATEMSTNAHNVKIITQDGKVTLRGPVDSEDEKSRIEKIAQDVAGKEHVDNQIEVTPK
jgi:hyperosmotically inducible periplasmic protein